MESATEFSTNIYYFQKTKKKTNKKGKRRKKKKKKKKIYTFNEYPSIVYLFY